MAQLVFQGHETRGKELHKLLEHLGGVDCGYVKCSCITCYYYINREGYIEGSNAIPLYMDKRVITTLEEFESKYPYKVGDKVIEMNGLHGTIHKISWDEHNCTVIYTFKDDEVGTNRHGYTANMLKPYKKEETMEKEIIYDEIDFNRCPCADKVQLILGDDYEVKVEDGKTFVVRKKSQYPMTFENCLKILGYNIAHTIPMNHGHNGLLMMKLQRLLICRDAYWKIAGNWKPDVMYGDLYCIGYEGIVVTWKMQGGCRLLAFPIEEMRDSFYENFKELIEECKELL